MDLIPNAFWLVRGDSWSSSEVGGVVASSAMAFLGTRLVASSFRSVQAASSTAPRPNPDDVKAAARSRIERLQSALDALGETESSEARGLQAALKEAERTAKERPFAVQVEECQAFIKRSQNRLVRLEEERAREQSELDAAMARMAKFRAEMAQSIPVAPPPASADVTQSAKIPDLVSELERLRARVAEMEAEREEARKKRSRSLSVLSPDLINGPDLTLQERGCARPACRAAQRRSDGNSDQPREYVGPVFQSFQPVGLTAARRVVLWGARGVRVGEARNPGPEMENSIRPTQWDSGAQSSLGSRASGLTSSPRVRHREHRKHGSGQPRGSRSK